MTLSSKSTVTLRPLVVRPYGDGYFRVFRWGYTSKVVTRQLGVDTLKHLQRGLSVAEVRSTIARQHGISPSQVNLDPLLGSLSAADMIAKIDSVAIPNRNRFRLGALSKFLSATYVKPLAYKAAGNLRPISAARAAFEHLASRKLKKTYAASLDQTKRNIQLVYQSSLAPAFSIDDYQRHLIRNIVDLDMISECNPVAVRRWMRSNVSMHGLNCLRQAQSQNKGVVLAIFHFGSPRILPVALSLSGIESIVVGPPNLGMGLKRTRELIQQYSSLPAAAPIHLMPGIQLDDLRQLISKLRTGATAICTTDALSLGVEIQDESRNRFFGANRSANPSGVSCIALGAQCAHLTSWIGWLGSLSGAVVVPVAVLREKTGALSITFDDPIDVPAKRRSAADLINRQLYSVFGNYLRRHPEQWFPWRNLHLFSPHEKGTGDCQPIDSGF